MDTDPTSALPSLLTTLQLSDSFFPSGRYTLSHGLESFAQAKRIDATTLEPLLADYLRSAVGPSDGVALACAHRAATSGDLASAARVDHRLSALKLVREAREASTRTGRQVLNLIGQLVADDRFVAYAQLVKRGEAPGNHAVVVGLSSAILGVDAGQAVAGELYAFAASFAGAAVRLGLIDHRTAQLLLLRVNPVIVEAALACRDREIDEMWSSLPLADLMGMRHETADLRLFAT